MSDTQQISVTHTPGPWEALHDSCGDDHAIFATSGFPSFPLIATTSGRDYTGDADAANARLIAKAPELLAVAKLALAWMRMTEGYVTAIEVEDRLAKAIAEADHA